MNKPQAKKKIASKSTVLSISNGKKLYIVSGFTPTLHSTPTKIDLTLPGPIGKTMELSRDRCLIEYGDQGLASVAILETNKPKLIERLDGGDAALKVLHVAKDLSAVLVACAPIKDFNAFTYVERWDLDTLKQTGYYAALDENENNGIIESGKLTASGAELSVLFDGDTEPTTLILNNKLDAVTLATKSSKKDAQRKMPKVPLAIKVGPRPYGLGGGIWQAHDSRPKDYEVGVPIDPIKPNTILSKEDQQKLCVVPCWHITLWFEECAYIAKGTVWHANACKAIQKLMSNLTPKLTFIHHSRNDPWVAPALTPHVFDKKCFEQLLADTIFADEPYDFCWLAVRNGSADAASYDQSVLIFSDYVEVCVPTSIDSASLIKILTNVLKGLNFAFCRVRSGLSGWSSIAALRHPKISVANKALNILEQQCDGLNEDVALFLGPRRLSSARGQKLVANTPSGVIVKQLASQLVLITPTTSPRPDERGCFSSSLSAKALHSLANNWLKKLKPTEKELDHFFETAKQ